MHAPATFEYSVPPALLPCSGNVCTPDETAGEVVRAFVTLKAGFTADAALEGELRSHARKRLGPAVAPREIVFRDDLPHTRSGKVIGRLLRARELALPEGGTWFLAGTA